MVKEYILGLDIGSSSVRGALFDMRGRLVRGSMVQRERRLRATRDGGAEIDADAAFRQVVAVIDEVLAGAAGMKCEFRTVASCSFWHSLVGIDEKGKPTTPVFGWADNRSREYVNVLRKRFHEDELHKEDELHNRTGARFHSSYWPAKLLWLRRTSPDIWTRTEKWLSFSDYLSMRLTGLDTTSVSMASGTGLFDIHHLIWDNELLRYLKVRTNSLPDVGAADDLSHTLLPKWRKRWPRLADAAWTPTIADGAANNIGSGCIDETKAALMLGTSGAMRVVYKGEPPKKIPAGLWCYRIDRERVLVGGALSDGGGLYDWLKRNLRIDMSDAATGKEMARRGAGAHGLSFMPFFAGERSTGYDENAAGSIHGLTMAHDGIDILQAAMESVAFRFADIYYQLSSIFPNLDIVTSGGALKASPVWTQIIADVFGRDILVSNEPEASLRGAVLLALANTGKIEITDRVSAAENRHISFHHNCHAIYKTARKRHQSVYETRSNFNS